MVVVGDEGREGGQDALELGRVLAGALGSDLLAVSVIGPGTSPHTRAEPAGEGARTVMAPSVARGLSDVAGEVGAAAVVVGSSHRGRIGRALLGTGAEHLAELVPCPLAVAPVGYARRYAIRLRRIEVVHNGSPGGRRALDLARRIAAGVPDGAVDEVGWDSASDAVASLATSDADMLILAGRARGRARHEHTSALVIV